MKQTIILTSVKLSFLILLCSLGTTLFAQTKFTHVYDIKGTDTLKLDLYTPNSIVKDSVYPLLLWMHGGGFSGGQRDHPAEVKLAELAADKGYVVASISYRLTRKGSDTGFGCKCPKEEKIETFKQAAIDYLDAASYLIKNAVRFQIDTSKIVAGGSSAGAEAVLSAVFMREFYIQDLDKYSDVNFAAVWSLAGALLDVDYITKANSIPAILFHGTEDKLVPISTNPHHFCDRTAPGYLMMDGSETIAKQLKVLGASYYFNVVEGGQHEVSGIPFQDIDLVFNFLEKTVIHNQLIQTVITKKASQ